MLKNFLDIIISLLIIIVLFPLFLLIGIITLFFYGFPIIYSSRRVGLQNKVFKIYKFRSMKNDSDEILGWWGQFIRKTNLDELLQFFNVIKGDMSIVGPRPHDEGEDIYFDKNINNYHLRKKIKPGITGLAAINGNRGGSDLEHIRKRVQWDIEYIENQSFILDCKIFIKTILLIFKPNH